MRTELGDQRVFRLGCALQAVAHRLQASAWVALRAYRFVGNTQIVDADGQKPLFDAR